MRHNLFRLITFLLIALISASTIDARTNHHRKRRPVRRASATVHGVEIDKQKYPVTGIDVSQYTGVIDFSKIVKNSAHAIDFVYLRASLGVPAYGPKAYDQRFDEYYRDATKQNLHVGAYHFFKFQYGGTAQANFFLQQIKGKKFDLPLVIDIEEYGNRAPQGGWDAHKIAVNIRAFIQTIRKERDEDIIFYSNRKSYHKYIKPFFSDEKLWICSFVNPESAESWRVDDWLFWQHSHKGRIAGAQNVVDINTFNGSRAEWNKFIQQCINDRDQRERERKSLAEK